MRVTLLAALMACACAHPGMGEEVATRAPEPDEGPSLATANDIDMSGGAESIEVDVEPIGAASAVVAPPRREPLGSFNLCGAGCAMDPRWTSGGKALPEDDD